MKIYSGKQKVGEIKGVSIWVDYDDLFKHRGESKFINQSIKMLSRLLYLLTLVIIGLSGSMILLSSSFSFENLVSGSVNTTILSISAWTFILAKFYGRDRDRYGINSENTKHSLHSLFEENSFEIDDVWDEKICEMVDLIYHKDPNNFIFNYSMAVLAQKSTSYLLEKRLGLNVVDLSNRLNRNLSMQSQTFDLTHEYLFLRQLEIGLSMKKEKIDEIVALVTFMKYYWTQTLLEMGFKQTDLEGLIIWLRNENLKLSYQERWKRNSKLKPKGDVNKAYTSKATPILDKFSEQLTKVSSKDDFTVAVSGEDEFQKIVGILQKSESANVLLVGEPGTGKTHLLKYIATRMVTEDVPEEIKDFRMVSVDLNRVFTYSEDSDKFKLNVQKIFEELVDSGSVILVLEEIGQIMSIREESRFEVLNLIINAVNKLNLKVIATCTYEEFNSRIKPYRSFSSLFEVIEILESDTKDTFQILVDESFEMTRKYNVEIQIPALKFLSEYASKVEFEKAMPEKAISILEDVVVSQKSKNLKFVDLQSMESYFESKLNLGVGNISESESKILQNLESILHQRIVGQDEAINAVSAALRRARAGLASKQKPVASFLFFGPTGVGKTEVSKVLADMYYGDEDSMIRLDMSEFQEVNNLERLIGKLDESGNLLGGMLTEAVRNRPFSLILLDEIEKANPKVLDLFLQILDEGEIKDILGRKVSFTNTIIIATSNVGSRSIGQSISKGDNYDAVFKTASIELKKFFRLEFLNRFDKVVMFKPLNKIEIRQIAFLMLEKMKAKLSPQGYQISWNEETLQKLSDLGYDGVYGARQLKRVIQDNVENQIAEKIVSGEVKPGSKLILDGLSIIKIN